MSNDRLRVKLIAAGYDEEIVMDMDREVMQSNYAEILITGGDAKGRVGPPLAGYDPDVEREKLAFEQKRWEAEQEEKRQLAEERRREEDKWLTAFVCGAGLFEFNRAPFGLRNSGNSFVRAITKILRPIREFTDSFVDDVAVHSDQ